MDIKAIHTYIENPELLTTQQLPLLEYIIKKYPYFQAARSLRLKVLKDNGSYLYNQSLKETAAHTTNREVLFEFITSDLFKKINPAVITNSVTTKENEATVEKEETTNENEVFESEALPTLEEDNEAISEIIEASSNAEEIPSIDLPNLTYQEADQIVDPDLFEPVEEENIEELEQELTKKPLEFNTSEIHSFNEWLQLSTLKIVHRSSDTEPQRPSSSTDKIKHKAVSENTDSNKKKNISSDLIDRFIESSPKISPLKKVENQVNLAKLNNKVPTDLMTETLAKVYLAQNNYKKAIQAYKILSLKNPEKSGFFADQIRKIEKLQANK